MYEKFCRNWAAVPFLLRRHLREAQGPPPATLTSGSPAQSSIINKI